MSEAVYWTPSEQEDLAAARFRRRLPGAGPSALIVSLALAAVAMTASGTAIAWKWHQYEAIDTASIAYQSPVQVSLPPEDFADAQVIHGRLMVLTPPTYAATGMPQNVVPLSAKIESSATVDALLRDNAAVDETVAADESRHEAETGSVDITAADAPTQATDSSQADSY